MPQLRVSVDSTVTVFLPVPFSVFIGLLFRFCDGVYNNASIRREMRKQQYTHRNNGNGLASCQRGGLSRLERHTVVTYGIAEKCRIRLADVGKCRENKSKQALRGQTRNVLH